MFSPPPLERGARSRWKPLPQAEAPTDLWVATGNPQPNERSLGAGPHRRLAPRTNKKHHRHLYIPSRRKKRPRRFLPRPQFSILNSSFSIHSRGVYVFHSGNTPSASLCSAAPPMNRGRLAMWRRRRIRSRRVQKKSISCGVSSQKHPIWWSKIGRKKSAIFTKFFSKNR